MEDGKESKGFGRKKHAEVRVTWKGSPRRFSLWTTATRSCWHFMRLYRFYSGVLHPNYRGRAGSPNVHNALPFTHISMYMHEYSWKKTYTSTYRRRKTPSGVRTVKRCAILSRISTDWHPRRSANVNCIRTSRARVRELSRFLQALYIFLHQWNRWTFLSFRVAITFGNIRHLRS